MLKVRAFAIQLVVYQTISFQLKLSSVMVGSTKRNQYLMSEPFSRLHSQKIFSSPFLIIGDFSLPLSCRMTKSTARRARIDASPKLKRAKTPGNESLLFHGTTRGCMLGEHPR